MKCSLRTSKIQLYGPKDDNERWDRSIHTRIRLTHTTTVATTKKKNLGYNLWFRLRPRGNSSEFFAGRNDGSACTNRQSADHGQNVITRCIPVRPVSINDYPILRTIICVFTRSPSNGCIYWIRDFAATWIFLLCSESPLSSDMFLQARLNNSQCIAFNTA